MGGSCCESVGITSQPNPCCESNTTERLRKQSNGYLYFKPRIRGSSAPPGRIDGLRPINALGFASPVLAGGPRSNNPVKVGVKINLPSNGLRVEVRRRRFLGADARDALTMRAVLGSSLGKRRPACLPEIDGIANAFPIWVEGEREVGAGGAPDLRLVTSPAARYCAP
jgi:hypothetical protein